MPPIGADSGFRAQRRYRFDGQNNREHSPSSRSIGIGTYADGSFLPSNRKRLGSTPRLWHNYAAEAFPMLASGNSEGSFPNPAS
jgi:hypothetical protein